MNGELTLHITSGDYLFIDTGGNVVENGQFFNVDEAHQQAICLAVKYQTSITAAILAFKVDKLLCSCGAQIEKGNDGQIICTDCEKVFMEGRA